MIVCIYFTHPYSIASIQKRRTFRSDLILWEAQNFLSFIIQIKMYGINSELARRMERRLRQKIYREMIEEQQEYRKKMEEEKIGSRGNYVRTEPDENDTVHSYKRRNKEPLQQHSTFLPVIHQRRSHQMDPEEGNRYNEAYQKYLHRRNGHSANVQKFNIGPRDMDREEDKSDDTVEMLGYKAKEQDQNQQKTKLYLQQCEQIISNLKDLTSKGSRKVKPKSSKYDESQSFFRRRPELVKSYNRQERELPERAKSFTPKYKEPILDKSDQLRSMREKTQSYSINSIRASINEANLKQPNFRPEQQEELNQFDQFAQSHLIQSKAPAQGGGENRKFKMGEKAKQNHRRIEPILKEEEEENGDQNAQQEKQQREDEEKQQRKNTERTKQTKPKASKISKQTNEKVARPLQSSPKTKKVEKKMQIIQPNSKNDQDEEDPEKLRKKQNAIVKYLKKARACGSLLYQKVQGHKKPSEQQKNESGGSPPEA